MRFEKAFVFVVTTFFLSWLLAFCYRLVFGGLNTPGAFAMLILYMYIPALVAYLLTKFVYRESVSSTLGISFKLNRWFLAAWLAPPAIALLAFAISLLFPGISFSAEMAGMFERFKSTLPPEQLLQMKASLKTMPIHPFWLMLVQGLIAGATINALAAFGEELGWRGFLPAAFSELSFWRSSLVIGLIWGLWHAPIILQGHNYPQHPQLGVLMMVIWCMLFSPIISYCRLKAKSVLAAAVCHGTINGTMGLSFLLLSGGSDLLIGGLGLAGFIALALANLAILVYDRYLSREPITV